MEFANITDFISNMFVECTSSKLGLLVYFLLSWAGVKEARGYWTALFCDLSVAMLLFWGDNEFLLPPFTVLVNLFFLRGSTTFLLGLKGEEGDERIFTSIYIPPLCIPVNTQLIPNVLRVISTLMFNIHFSFTVPLD
jgi:hypothetical protein